MAQIRPHPLTRSITHSLHGAKGVALLELLLIVGVVAIAAAATVGTAVVVNNHRKSGNEVRHAVEIAQNINAASMTGGNYAFATLNQANAISNGLFPAEMLDTSGNPKSEWGGDVLLTGTPVDGKPDYGAALIFADVPPSACTRFVSDAASGFYSVSVNDQLVKNSYGPLDIPGLTSLCSATASRVQFVHAKNGGAGLGPPGSTSTLPPPPPVACTPQAPTTETIVDTACPAGMLGSRTYETRYTCYAPTGEIISQRPALLSDTCARACVLPSPAIQSESESRTAVRTPSCPSGQSGSITQTRVETRHRERYANCPTSPGYTAPVGDYSWTLYQTWTPWVGQAWETINNTCANDCVLPSPAIETSSQQFTMERTLECPEGQIGAGTVQSMTLRQPLAREASCLQATGSSSWGPWTTSGPAIESPWSTTSYSCAPACIAPPYDATPTTRTAPDDVRVEACDPGFSGTITYRRSRIENGITGSYYVCPAATGSYTAKPFTEWFGTYMPVGAWSTTKSCTTTCVVPPTSSGPTTRNIQEENETLACANGAPGFIRQQRFLVEYGTQTTSWTCPYASQGAVPAYTYVWSGTFGHSPWMYVEFQCDYDGVGEGEDPAP